MKDINTANLNPLQNLVLLGLQAKEREGLELTEREQAYKLVITTRALIPTRIIWFSLFELNYPKHKGKRKRINNILSLCTPPDIDLLTDVSEWLKSKGLPDE